MSRRNKIIVSVLGIFIVLLALIGITYAYFLTRVEGNTNDTSISITTANLRIVYDDNNSQINATNIQPGDTVYTKTFTVTNEGNETVDYEVYLENVINDFVHEEDLLMFITCSSNIIGNKCNGFGNGSVTGNIPIFKDSIYPLTNSRLIQNSIEPASTGVDAEVHTYTLYLKFRDNGDQSDDMGKVLQGKIQIYDPKNVVAISGIVTGYDSSYYVELRSDVKTSEIGSDGSYIFYGVEPETNAHTIYIKKRNNDGSVSEIGNKTINVTKGTEQSINTDASSIIINDDSYKATVNITIPSSKDTIVLTGVKISDIPFDEGTLAYKIISNGADVTEKIVTGEFVEDPTCGYGQKCLDNVEQGCPGTCFATGTEEITYVTKNTKTIKNSADFNNTAKGISWDETIGDYTNDGLFSAKDDYGISYYYRGPVTNNYLTIGTMCWRIVRIEGDGSVKLILEDQDEACSETMNGNWDISTVTNGTIKTGNFGYSKTENNKYIMNYLNLDGLATNYDISMATAFKNYQTGPMASYIGKLKAGNWCLNDKAYSSSSVDLTIAIPLTETEKTTLKNAGTSYYYDSFVRLYGNSIKTPTLKCNGTIMDNFDTDTGMYVGALTADEIACAGGKVRAGNSNFYLLNDYQKSSSLYFWLLTPDSFLGDSGDGAFRLNDFGGLGNFDVNSTKYSFRPSVVLKSGTLISGGEGTLDKPYTIE